MKKSLLLTSISLLLISGLTSCAQKENQINLTPKESRNLRIASSLGTLNHLEENDKEKVLNSNTSLEKEIENILYSVEVLLVNNFKIKTTNQAEGDFERFGDTYSNLETISFISTKEKEISLNIYFNNIEEESDIKYDENIDGIVTSYYYSELNPSIESELKLIDFTSTSCTKKGDQGDYIERKLSLYHKESKIDNFEISEFKSKDVHQFYYEYRANDKEIISYSIDLNQNDDISMMFSLLGYKLKFLRIVDDNQVSYKVGIVNGSEFVQILRFTKKVADDGSVTYHVTIEI